MISKTRNSAIIIILHTRLTSFRTRDAFASDLAFKLANICVWNWMYCWVCGWALNPSFGVWRCFFSSSILCWRRMLVAVFEATPSVSEEWMACLATSCKIG